MCLVVHHCSSKAIARRLQWIACLECAGGGTGVGLRRFYRGEAGGKEKRSTLSAPFVASDPH